MTAVRQEDLPHYTVADYVLWQGDWELICGVPYAMSPAPSITHQSISSKIHVELAKGLENCKKCQALLPVDWRIDDDTVVQPDNLVVCGDVSGQYLTRAPVVIFEVLSPATAKKDQGLKFDLYQREGVGYYVIVNPETQVAKVFQRTEDGRLVKRGDLQQETFHFSWQDCAMDFRFATIWPV